MCAPTPSAHTAIQSRQVVFRPRTIFERHQASRNAQTGSMRIEWVTPRCPVRKATGET